MADHRKQGAAQPLPDRQGALDDFLAEEREVEARLFRAIATHVTCDGARLGIYAAAHAFAKASYRRRMAEHGSGS